MTESQTFLVSALNTLGRRFICGLPSSYIPIQTIQHDGLKELIQPELHRGISGALCATTSTVAVYPLSLLLTRLKLGKRGVGSRHGEQSKREDTRQESIGRESDSNNRSGLDEIAQAVKDIYDEGGIKAFYVGLTEAAGKAFADVLIFFLIYRSFRRRLDARVPRKLTLVGELILGILSDLITKFITAPLETLVTRKQNFGPESGVTDLVTRILHKQGITGLWAGYSATLLTTMSPLIALLINSPMLVCLRQLCSPELARGVSAAITRVAIIALYYPIEVAKARMQTTTQDTPVGASETRESLVNSRPQSLLHTITEDAGIGSASRDYAGIFTSAIHDLLLHGTAEFTKSAIYTLITRVYYMYLLSGQYPALAKAKRELRHLTEVVKKEAYVADGAVNDGKKIIETSVNDMISNETADLVADLVADYVEDGAKEWRKFYHLFWEKDKK